MILKQKQEREKEILDYSSIDSSLITITSFSIGRFFAKTLDAVEEFGFTGLEFASMVLLHLKSVTPKYPKEDFRILLNTLKNSDSEFEQSEFMSSLIFMRKICTQEDSLSDIYEFLELENNISGVDDIISVLSLFSTHLIENTIRLMNQVRKEYPLRQYNVAKVKELMTKKFAMVMNKTLNEVITNECDS